MFELSVKSAFKHLSRFFLFPKCFLDQLLPIGAASSCPRSARSCLITKGCNEYSHSFTETLVGPKCWMSWERRKEEIGRINLWKGESSWWLPPHLCWESYPLGCSQRQPPSCEESAALPQCLYVSVLQEKNKIFLDGNTRTKSQITATPSPFL